MKNNHNKKLDYNLWHLILDHFRRGDDKNQSKNSKKDARKEECSNRANKHDC